MSASDGGWTDAEVDAEVERVLAHQRATMPGYPRFLALAAACGGTKALDRDAVLGAFAGMRPNDWLAYALGFLDDFRPEDGAWLLAEAWPGSEFPSGAGVEEAVAAFRRVGFATNGPGLERPAGPIAVFRGADQPKAWRNLSWTADEGVAEWFARRWARRRPGYLWAAEIDPGHVLGRIAHEATVLVDPDGLRGVRVLRRVAPRPDADSG